MSSESATANTASPLAFVRTIAEPNGPYVPPAGAASPVRRSGVNVEDVVSFHRKSPSRASDADAYWPEKITDSVSEPSRSAAVASKTVPHGIGWPKMSWAGDGLPKRA